MLPFMGPQTVGHDLATEHQRQQRPGKFTFLNVLKCSESVPGW